MSLSMQDVLAGRPQLPTMTNDMDALAVRIARNREIAGLHYPSDSDAGTLLAGEIHNLLNSLNAYSWYKNALGAAVAEWQP